MNAIVCRASHHRARVLAVSLALGLLPRLALAGPPNTDPDWPCPQPLVPAVSAAMVWDGPSLDDAADWRSDRSVADLVDSISPSDVPADDGKAAIDKFLKSHKRDRLRAVKRAFAGLLEENNAVRARVIEDIKMLAERQRGLADVVTRLAAEQSQAGPQADPELTQRWTFAQRTYYEGQRTLRYACEKPAELDQRLGTYARALKSALPQAPATPAAAADGK